MSASNPEAWMVTVDPATGIVGNGLGLVVPSTGGVPLASLAPLLPANGKATRMTAPASIITSPMARITRRTGLAASVDRFILSLFRRPVSESGGGSQVGLP